MNKKKKLTSIITNVKVVFYIKNVSDKMTFYKKFEGQNTATGCAMFASAVWDT